VIKKILLTKGQLTSLGDFHPLQQHQGFFQYFLFPFLLPLRSSLFFILLLWLFLDFFCFLIFVFFCQCYSKLQCLIDTSKAVVECATKYWEGKQHVVMYVLLLCSDSVIL
jgi:hypothetical protein